MNQKSVFIIYSAAHLYSMTGLVSNCLDFFDTYALETLVSPGLLQLSVLALTQLINRNSFCAPEIDIFSAVKRWIESQTEEVLFKQFLINKLLFLV